NCIIVDDEPIAQEILENYISQTSHLHLAGKCSSAFEAMAMLHAEKIDLMFLDIKMPALTGLDMLKTLSSPPKVILTTAFSEFAVESYEYGISDYLLKPVSFERFLKAVNRLSAPKHIDFPAAGEQGDTSAKASFMFFKADKKIYKFYLSEIVFFEGCGNYVKVHAQNKNTILVLDKLSELEEKLPSGEFIRVHKSFIANLSHISMIEGNIIKAAQKEIPISKTYKELLMKALSSK
ncbi:MAG TPA: LytTR family DNA-binding domain-containing protein, partial [Flavobacterium sp.]|nr:LytTR family DNA-binding domain-containing protein [Flavobacterium sp.]